MAEPSRLARIAAQFSYSPREINAAIRDFDALRASIGKFSGLKTGIKETGGALKTVAGSSQQFARALGGLNAQGLGQIFAAIDDVNDIARITSQDGIGTLGKGLAALGGVAVGVGVGLEILKGQLAGVVNGLDAASSANRLYYETIYGPKTTQQVQDQIVELERLATIERAVIADQESARAKAFEDAVRQYGEPAARVLFAAGKLFDDKSQQVLDAAKNKLSELEAGIIALGNAAKTGEIAANDDRVALEALTKAEKELSDLRLKAATEDGQRILAENEKIFAAIARQNEQLASAYQKYEQDIANLQDTYQQDRIQAEKDYQQTLVDIADAAAKAAEDALARLTEKRDQLAADFAQGEVDAQRQLELDRQQIIIDAQRQEAQAYRDHQRNLRDIQIEAARERERLAEDRDFAGLFDLERQTSQRMEDANRAFEDERSDRQTALEQERVDLLASYEIERQQRFEQYQRNLNDAQEQYKRELILAERNRREALSRAQQAYSAELVMLYQKLQTEMEARRAAAIAEITLINQTEQQKLAIIEQYAIAARNFLASTFAPVTAPASNNTSVAYTQNVNVSGAGFGPGINGVIRNVTRGVLQEFLT